MLKSQLWLVWSIVIVLGIAQAPLRMKSFEPLFNGENLEGWTVQGLEKAGPKVEDGVLVVGGWDYWAVITKEQYQDFILRFDVKFDPKGNSGICFIPIPKQYLKMPLKFNLHSKKVMKWTRTLQAQFLTRAD